MSHLPMISYKSKLAQAELGVDTAKSAKRKLLKYGVRLIDGEYVSRQQLEQLTHQKLETEKAAAPKQDTAADWLSGSPFEE